MASMGVTTLKGQRAKVWLIRKQGKVWVSQMVPKNRIDVPGIVTTMFCAGFVSGKKCGMLDKLYEDVFGAREQGKIVSVLGISRYIGTLPEIIICYAHACVSHCVFDMTLSCEEQYTNLIEAGMQPSLIRAILLNSLERNAFWHAIQKYMDKQTTSEGIQNAIRGMPDILISTIRHRQDSLAAKALIQFRCFNTVGPLDTRFAGLFDGNHIVPWSRQNLLNCSYKERRIPVFDIKRRNRGKMAHMCGVDVKHVGIRSESHSPYSGFMAYGALNCPAHKEMTIVVMHVMADGGPDDEEASLKCRVLLAVTFPLSSRKRKKGHIIESHPLLVFESVSNRILEQISHTGMTSKGGIRPIITMEGHPFHAGECYVERLFRGDRPYSIVLKWRGMALRKPLRFSAPESVSFSGIIRMLIKEHITVVDRPLSELMLRYFHGQTMGDFCAPGDLLPIEAVLGLELFYHQFKRLRNVLLKVECEENGEHVAEGDLKDFIIFAKDSFQVSKMHNYTFEETLLRSTENCMVQCGIFLHKNTKIECNGSFIDPNLICVAGMQ